MIILKLKNKLKIIDIEYRYYIILGMVDDWLLLHITKLCSFWLVHS